MNSHLSDGMPRQDCEPGATKGKQERGAAQVDALVVAVIIMIIMYDSNISGNDMYDDAGLYCRRGLKKRRGIMCISVTSLDTLREEIRVQKNQLFKDWKIWFWYFFKGVKVAQIVCMWSGGVI